MSGGIIQPRSYVTLASTQNSTTSTAANDNAIGVFAPSANHIIRAQIIQPPSILKKLSLWVFTNSRSGSSVHTVKYGTASFGTSSSIVVTVGAGLTGLFIDDAHEQEVPVDTPVSMHNDYTAAGAGTTAGYGSLLAEVLQ